MFKFYVDNIVDYYKQYADYYGVSFEQFLTQYAGINGVSTEDEFRDFVKADYKKSTKLVDMGLDLGEGGSKTITIQNGSEDPVDIEITADTTTDITGKGNFTGTLKDVEVKVIGKDDQKNKCCSVH